MIFHDLGFLRSRKHLTLVQRRVQTIATAPGPPALLQEFLICHRGARYSIYLTWPPHALLQEFLIYHRGARYSIYLTWPPPALLQEFLIYHRGARYSIYLKRLEPKYHVTLHLLSGIVDSQRYYIFKPLYGQEWIRYFNFVADELIIINCGLATRE